MTKPKDKESDAGREYAEIWGETIHSNRHLRVFSIVLGVLLLLVTIAVVRLSSVEPPRPIVVRVDEVGRAEALAYEAVEAQADPRDPTTKYFLNRFLHDHFGRRRATAQQYWPRSLRFLSTDLANAAFTTTNEEIALLAAGITLEVVRCNSGSRMSCFGFKPIPLSLTGRWPTSSSSAPGRNGRYPAKHGRPRCSLFSCRSYRPTWSF